MKWGGVGGPDSGCDRAPRRLRSLRRASVDIISSPTHASGGGVTMGNVGGTRVGNEPTPTRWVDEEARRRFEDAWCDGRPQSIEDFLPPGDHPSFRATLEELVLIELEFAWKAGEATPPRVEDYLRRFPDLDQPDVVLRLAREEFLVR